MENAAGVSKKLSPSSSFLGLVGKRCKELVDATPREINHICVSSLEELKKEECLRMPQTEAGQNAWANPQTRKKRSLESCQSQSMRQPPCLFFSGWDMSA